MVRAPCCDKMGLKKGPWSPEEDRILISHIQNYGHGNWRALPKQAGLLRCGKSCRLRWINYLRPDIKRGNFTREEEDTIIKLHETLGNRWSAIAAQLPGRTDNEIKNIWHTHLKKRLIKPNNNNDTAKIIEPKRETNINVTKQSESANSDTSNYSPSGDESLVYAMSPQPSSSSDNSTVTSFATAEINNIGIAELEEMDSTEIFPVIDEEFWTDPQLLENSSSALSSLGEFQLQYPLSSTEIVEPGYISFDGPNVDDGMDFWYDLFVHAGGMEGLL